MTDGQGFAAVVKQQFSIIAIGSLLEGAIITLSNHPMVEIKTVLFLQHQIHFHDWEVVYSHYNKLL